MTQGAPNSTDTNPPTELDLDAWLAKRGLLDERPVTVGGKRFRFTAAATGDQVVAYNAALKEGSIGDALATLLVDPDEHDELVEAFKRQRQPLTAKLEQEFFRTVLDYVITGDIAGDAGESSAS